jgi:hypothetical protein
MRLLLPGHALAQQNPQQDDQSGNAKEQDGNVVKAEELVEKFGHSGWERVVLGDGRIV